MSNLNATAYHEAGHAVVGNAMGRKVLRVSIKPNPEKRILGLCTYEKWADYQPDINTDSETMNRIRAEVVSKLAGALAEERAIGYRDHVGASDDYAEAKDRVLFAVTDDSEIQSYIDQAIETAKSILESRWPQVEIVAQLLLQHSELDAAQVQEAIAEATTQQSIQRKRLISGMDDRE